MRLQIKDIIPNPANPRVIRDEQFKKLKQSLAQFPQMLEKRPIAVTKEGGKYIALGGNQRLRALLDLKQEIGDADFEQRYTAGAAEMETLLGYFSKGVPVVDCTELTPMQQKRFIIADNVPFGEWDWEGLANEWDVEELADWGLNVPGWEPAPEEGDEVSDEELDESAEDAEEIQTDIKLGDLFEIGPHRLLCGDSTSEADVSRLMNGRKADMCHTDPPYNIDYEGGSKKREKIANDKLDNFPEFLFSVYSIIAKNMKPGGAIYVWHASSETHNFIQQYLNAGFLFKSYIVWNKNNSTFGRADYHWKHEPCIYGWLSGGSHKWCGDRKQTTVWDVDRPSRSDEHPTMKPIALCLKAILNSSEKKDLLIDVFLGSGSTMVAAQQCGRTCYGLELDPKYCQVIINRMQKLYPSLQITKNGQPYATTNTTTE